MMTDRLAVPERQLTQPPQKKAVSLSAITRGKVTCKAHGNAFSVASTGNTAWRVGPDGEVAVKGEVKIKFIGCKCIEWRPLK